MDKAIAPRAGDDATQRCFSGAYLGMDSSRAQPVIVLLAAEVRLSESLQPPPFLHPTVRRSEFLHIIPTRRGLVLIMISV